VKITSSGGLAEFEKRVLDGDTRRDACARPPGHPAQHPRPAVPDVELRAKPDGTGGERLLFTGYASVVEAPFTMWDWLRRLHRDRPRGAFTKTLSEDPDVIFCLNHDWLRADGAHQGRAPCGSPRTRPGSGPRPTSTAPATTSTGCSPAWTPASSTRCRFAFYVTKQTWSPDYDQRDILEVDIDGGDTSVVTFPANPATTGTTDLRARAGERAGPLRVPHLLVERARAEKRAGKALSATMRRCRRSSTSSPTSPTSGVDSAQEILSELMGVPNPDDDSTWGARHPVRAGTYGRRRRRRDTLGQGDGDGGVTATATCRPSRQGARGRAAGP
jgi:hypothetical protein